VSRRLEHLEAHVRPEVDRIPVFRRHELVLGRRTCAEMDRRPHALAQLEVPGHEVGVEVGEEHVADRQPQTVRVRQILVHVALRIDDRGFAAIANEVRRVS